MLSSGHGIAMAIMTAQRRLLPAMGLHKSRPENTQAWLQAVLLGLTPHCY